MHAVKASDQLAAVPDFDRMAMPHGEQLGIEVADAAIDPGAAPPGPRCGAAVDHGVKIVVDFDLEAAPLDGAGKPSRYMHAVERQDAAALGLDPVKGVIVGAFRHGKDAAGIGLEQHLRRDLDHDVVDGGHGSLETGPCKRYAR